VSLLTATRPSNAAPHRMASEGVTLGDEGFIGDGVIFANDKRPRAAGETVAGVPARVVGAAA
jgi:hypothetical protein